MRRAIVLGGLLLLPALAAAQVVPPAPAPVSFWREVLPLLQARCAGCHQPGKAKAGLVLTDHAAIRRGGDDPAVVAGDPDQSLLTTVLLPHDGEPPAMPEKDAPLAAAEIALLRRWIAEGAGDDTPPGQAVTFDAEHPPRYPQAPVIPSLAFSPDGALLAVAGRHEVLLHSGDGTRLVGRLIGRSERIESLAFAADGRRLAAAGGTPGRFGELQVWDVAAGELKVSVAPAHDCLLGVSWSPDGRLLACGAADRAIRAFDAQSGAQVLFQGASEDWVLDTVFSTDGAHLVSVGRDRSMKLIRVDTQQFIDHITSITPGAVKGGLMAVDRHPQRDELLCGGADGTPRLYRMFREKERRIGDDYNLLRALPPLPGRVTGVAFLPGGERVVAACSDARAGEVRCWRIADGQEVWRHRAAAGLYAVAVAPVGDCIAIGGFAGRVTLLRAADGEVLREFVPVPLETPPTADQAAGGER